ncbi:BOI-related E3 ubiquitin-protein ligase 1 [Quillaja saponaria]|uniref:BOI-related E3 ubiquitin-protein ligase 1 n=1 Tax=Quillaja saponaria TaxID=32244 RepID=A0AAD7M3U8_QUISA|nr:BOI-related E3 ubiquitin-protein ligase 1 [Quillaja saponaria]
MAVEAPHMELFPPQSLANSNREFIKPNQVIADIYNTQMMKVDSAPPLAAIMPENQLPFYQSTNICHPASAKTSMNKSESVVTYNIPSSQRKRPRNSTTDSNANDLIISEKNKLFRSEQSFLDQDTIYQFQQQQSEIEFFIAQHAEKMKLEMEERRIRQSTMWLSAIQETVMKKLKGKDEEIQRMGKLNWVLQERAKSLSVENQIWMDLAQNNEAAANSLRNDLENILAHFNEEHHNYGCAAVDPLSDDAESCYGSNDLDGRR